MGFKKMSKKVSGMFQKCFNKVLFCNFCDPPRVNKGSSNLILFQALSDRHNLTGTDKNLCFCLLDRNGQT